MRIKILLLFFVFLINANAEIKKEAKNIIEGASNGRKVVDENTLKPVNSNRLNEKLYYDETILNWYYLSLKENARGKEVVGTTGKDFLIKNVENVLANKDNNISNIEELAVVKGFCFIRDEINVGEQPMSLRVECQTNVGSIVMFANLVNLNEKLSLIVDPKYIEKNGYRFEVKKSIVTNENRTSYNVATYVNNRIADKVAYGTLSVGSDEVKNASNEYLKALEESKKKQSVEYISIPDGQGGFYPQATQNTNTEKPDPLNYLIKGAINVTASAVKTFADISKENLPYLYQIVPKTKIWIDLKVNKKGEYVK